jgi:hypothetical protein
MTKIVACPNCCEILHLSRHLVILEEVDDNEEREGGMEKEDCPGLGFFFSARAVLVDDDHGWVQGDPPSVIRSAWYRKMSCAIV